MYAVSFIYINLSSHCFPFFILLSKLFLSPRKKAFFHRYHHRLLTFPLNFSIALSPTSVTCHSDFCHHWQFKLKPSYFHHLAGVSVAVVHEEASPTLRQRPWWRWQIPQRRQRRRQWRPSRGGRKERRRERWGRQKPGLPHLCSRGNTSVQRKRHCMPSDNGR